MNWNSLLLRTVSALGLLAAGGFASTAQAQTFTGTANVINLLPNTIVGHEDLDFGNVIAPALAATLALNAQTGALTSTGGLILAGGTPNQGEFTGYGTPNRNVVLNGPAAIILTHTNGINVMTVTTLRMSVNGGAPRPIAGAQRLNAAGFIFLKIGGTLLITAGQLQGSYSGTYLVTANYI